MNKNTFKYALFLAIGAMLWQSCAKEFTPETPTAGNANFSRYVAVGNSITAGYTGSGMTKTTQDNSLANLLATQFKMAGGGEFKQPTMTENGSGVLQVQALTTVPPCNIDSKPTILRSTVDAAWGDDISAQGPFNNIAVPGMSVKASDQANFANNPLQPNPYMARMISNDGQSYKSLVEETVTAIDPTFFTLWLGNNDILTYAGTGGGFLPNYFTSQTIPVPCGDVDQSQGILSIPSDDQFRTKYSALLDIVTANGAKGVVSTIPDITALPLFTTVKHTVTSPSDCTTQLPIYITTASGVRTATVEDYVLLPTGSAIGRPDTLNGFVIPHGLNELNPLCNSEVLDKSEAQTVLGKTTLFNTIIKEEAAERNIPVVDMYAFMNSIKNGTTIDGIDVSSKFISGGAFGLDGVHPADRGYAIVANEFIRTINASYGATLPLVDVGRFKGVTLP